MLISFFVLREILWVAGAALLLLAVMAERFPGRLTPRGSIVRGRIEHMQMCNGATAYRTRHS